MTDTPNLALPYILAAQSQKHITHNEAIRALDCLVQIAVLDRDLATPPSTPGEGARYIVAASPAGAWTGATGKLAAFQDGAWEIYTPNEGWLAWVADENALVVYDGGGWSAVSSTGGGGTSDHGLLTGLGDDDHPHYHNDARGDARYTPIAPSTLGINATADTTNRLSLSSAASLFNHAGSGHQQKINKASSAQTASQLYQSSFSGRAEIGLIGDDDFRFKVSPDGSIFHDAIVIDRNSGRVAFPKSSYREVLTANRTYYVRADGNNANTGLVNNSGGAFLTLAKAWSAVLGIDLAGYVVTIQFADGTYNASTTLLMGDVVGGTVVFAGNAASPSNVVLSGATTLDIYSNSGLTFQYLRISGSFIGLNINAAGANVTLGTGVSFAGTPTYTHINVGGGRLNLGAITIVSSANAWLTVQLGAVVYAGGTTFTFSGTPAWTTAGIVFDGSGSNITLSSVTMSGSATGKRYQGVLNATLQSFAAGTASTYFPGNSNGTVATGAQQA